MKHCFSKISLNFTLLLCLGLSNCHEDTAYLKSTYRYTLPSYDLVSLEVGPDSIHISLNDTTYNDAESLNLFNVNGIDYVSYYDERSASINIYDLVSRTTIKRISLKDLFKERSLHKTTVYIINFDSIFVTNKMKLYLFDSAGHRKGSVPFLDKPRFFRATLDNSNPPIIINNNVFTAVKPSVGDNTLKAFRKWKVLYELNLVTDSAKLFYHLPEIYRKDLYGYQYLQSSYCYHDGRFVFSFAADTNVYETDLASLHQSFFGKSRFQHEDVKGLSGSDIKSDLSSMNYATHHAYGAIYYDRLKRRFLRVSRHKVSKADYEAKNRIRRQSLIIFDEKLRIIGESIIDEDVDLGSLLIMGDGRIYARANRKDEYALHFVRLVYKERMNLAQGKTQ